MFGKLLAAFISPLGTSLALGLLCAVLLACAGRAAWRRLGMGLGVVALAWLWLWSTPLVSDALRGAIEAKAGPRDIDAVATAPVIVVLGGGVSGPRLPLRPHPDLGASADRMWHAARLYRAGKSPALVLSGGTVRTGDGSEAEAMRAFLLDLGVPDAALLIEAASEDTATNAAHTARLLLAQGIDSAVLVTSALHMPRARQAFERAGLRILPAPTDFEVIDVPFDVLRIVPDAGALQASARAMKEIVGLLAGRFAPSGS
ncbi:hypothetical protein CKCBHOJB_01707 [Thauera sp. GDN1]|uniref:YdcF family protein n=1 Tax=Thauera sp. GDN1 TaxID=2944810 RepID=UPI0024788C1D|nr:YdcF family protein [Thauera sp. GDN1]WEN42122.1 hypothetical protein CKCBHOJB_01707 [Thauera sp. GDN1]